MVCIFFDFRVMNGGAVNEDNCGSLVPPRHTSDDGAQANEGFGWLGLTILFLMAPRTPSVQAGAGLHVVLLCDMGYLFEVEGPFFDLCGVEGQVFLSQAGRPWAVVHRCPFVVIDVLVCFGGFHDERGAKFYQVGVDQRVVYPYGDDRAGNAVVFNRRPGNSTEGCDSHVCVKDAPQLTNDERLFRDLHAQVGAVDAIVVDRRPRGATKIFMRSICAVIDRTSGASLTYLVNFGEMSIRTICPVPNERPRVTFVILRGTRCDILERAFLQEVVNRRATALNVDHRHSARGYCRGWSSSRRFVGFRTMGVRVGPGFAPFLYAFWRNVDVEEDEWYNGLRTGGDFILSRGNAFLFSIREVWTKVWFTDYLLGGTDVSSYVSLLRG